MRVGVALLAAGSSTRFGTDKLSNKLNGKPLWMWSVETFAMHPRVQELVLVANQNNFESISKALISNGAKATVVIGGANRQESSRIGVQLLAKNNEIALIHDCARPLVSHSLISNVVDACERFGAAAPVLQVTDTVRKFDPTSAKNEILPREHLGFMQTPQGAKVALLLEAYSKAETVLTDEMGLIESMGVSWHPVAGEKQNIKVTLREDLDYVKGLLLQGESAQMETRVGMGYDIHPFSSDAKRPMYLGGVLFESEIGLEGHSDADALIHAVVDALLGAAGMGDIGHHFPPSDPQWKDVRSTLFLKHAFKLVSSEGWKLVNLDCTVIAERPRLRPREAEIRGVFAEILHVSPDRIGLKATTNEGLGAIGRREGLAAMAVATLSRQN